MVEELTDEELRKKAERRVKQKVQLLYSIGIWIAISIFMFVIWYLNPLTATSGSGGWSVGWGLRS